MCHNQKLWEEKKKKEKKKVLNWDVKVVIKLWHKEYYLNILKFDAAFSQESGKSWGLRFKIWNKKY